MNACLICVRGSRQGDTIALSDQQGLHIRVRDRDAFSGELLIAWDADGWRFANASQVPSTVNGMVTQGCVLLHGDSVCCAAHTFELRCDLPAGTGVTLATIEIEAAAISPMEAAEQASRSDLEVVPALGGEKRSKRRRRNSRRLSASRKAVIYRSGRRAGFLQRLGISFRPFKRNDERRERLRELERERERLLCTAGRLALEQEGAIGLPQGLLLRLASGHSVTLRQDHLLAPQLERYKRHHQHLRWLDAEILTLRSQLGLTVIDEAPVFPELEQDRLAQEERVFQAMDGHATEDVVGQIESGDRIIRGIDLAAVQRKAAAG